jgi:hypothetical protein
VAVGNCGDTRHVDDLPGLVPPGLLAIADEVIEQYGAACLLMEWSGRAPASPASDVERGLVEIHFSAAPCAAVSVLRSASAAACSSTH